MNKTFTVIQFASLVHKAPQQIYGSIKNGAFPSEFITQVPKATGGFQPMIMEEALEWFQQKEIARLSKAGATVPQVYSVDQLLIDLMESNKKGLATQIKNFLETRNA